MEREETIVSERIKSLTRKNGEVYLTNDDKLLLIKLILKDGLTIEEAVDAIYVEKYAPIREAFEELLNVSRMTRRGIRNFQDLDTGKERGKVKLPNKVKDAYAKEDIESCNQYLQNIAAKVEMMLCYGEDLEKIKYGAQIDKTMDKTVRDAIVEAVYGDIDFFENELAGDIYEEDKSYLIQSIKNGKTAKDAVYNLFEIRYKSVLNRLKSESKSNYKKAEKLENEGGDFKEALETAQRADADIARLYTYRGYMMIFAKGEYLKAHPVVKGEKSETAPTALKGEEEAAPAESQEGETPVETQEGETPVETQEGETPVETQEEAAPAETQEGPAANETVVDAISERIGVAETTEPVYSPFENNPEYTFTEKEMRVLADAGYDTPEALFEYISRKSYALVKASASRLVHLEEELENEESETKR